MIIFSKEDGFIKPQGIRNLEGKHDLNIKLPHIAIGVFSEHLFNDIIRRLDKSEKIGEVTEHRYVYILEYKNIKLTLFQAGVGGSWISHDIEILNSNGVDTFIIFGNCGVLDKTIEDCSIIIPNIAYRDEGTSYHYLPDSDYLELDDKYKKIFKTILKENNLKFTEGATWTIDAFYRETKEKIEMFKNKGVICVEMEGASIGAICKYKKLDYFTFYYAGDNLDSQEWEERSITQLASFDKKIKIPILALELAYRIENK